MSGKDQREPTGGHAPAAGGVGEAQADPSRRALLRGAAGVGVASVAASTLISLPVQALASTARPAKPAAAGRRPAAKPATGESARDAKSARDVVVHVRDPRSGEMEIFSGTSMTRLNDPDLARRLMRAIG
jgi:hypothetical protein